MNKSVLIARSSTIEDNLGALSTHEGMAIDIETALTPERVVSIEDQGEFNNSIQEESIPRRVRLLSDVYERCIFAL